MKARDLVNVPLLIISVVAGVVGYFLLGMGPVDNPLSWSVAPGVLVGVYIVLLPATILMKK